MPEASSSRRPLKTRQRRWPRALAAWLSACGASPNAISVASLVFAALGATCLLAAPVFGPLGHALLLGGAVAGIQLRLLCNLLDGLVAVEGGKKTASGELFNDVPDRIADVALFVCAGYGIRSIAYGGELGWAAAVVAVLTAYVRYVGAAMGAPQLFIGPMAKQQRMALLTVAALVAAIESIAGWPERAIAVALAIIVVGGLVTVVRRLLAIARIVESR